MTTVVDTLYLAWTTVNEDKKVSFRTDAQIKSHSDAEADGDDESSDGMSSRSRESTSMDHSSRETSPEVSARRKGGRSPAVSILKKQSQPAADDMASTSDASTKKMSAPKVKKGVRLGGIQSPTTGDGAGGSEVFSTSTPRGKGTGGVIKFMNNNPYTSNPVSDDESEV